LHTAFFAGYYIYLGSLIVIIIIIIIIMWNQAVHTDREVTANGPDIIIENKKEKP
jgi:hypothetical protein